MRFSLTALVALVAATAVSAANVLVDAPGHAISKPTLGDKVVVKEPFTIVWDPTGGSDMKVTLMLRKGDSDNLDTVGPIAENISNKGTYEWTPDANLVADDDYAIEIRWEAGGTVESNYSPKFTIVSDVKETSTTDASSTTATSTTASSTETETETATGTTTLVTSTVSANSTSTSSPTRSSSVRPTGSGEPVIPSDDKGAAGKVGISMFAVAAAAVAYFA